MFIDKGQKLTKMKLFTVLVLYKKKLEASQTFISLIDSYLRMNSSQLNFFLLIYDNSPTKQELLSKIPFRYQYIHDPQNSGLSVAYNYALRIAALMNFPWLLLLDHDSKLPLDYIFMIARVLESNSSNESIVAYVPKVICNGGIVSPSRIMLGIQSRPININYIGICDFQITAINSGSLLKVSFMEHIQGFNNLFQLDYLDHWLFDKIYLSGKKVYVFNSIVQHDLSVSNMNTNMMVRRYINILESEKLFYLKYKSRGGNIFYLIKLFVRFFRLIFFVRDKTFAFIVLRQLYDSTQIILSSSVKRSNKF